ncbi:hypothetical protein FZW83_07695 [Listeria monocytogenes]|uniref:hypothetical protein n=1 Tax=Listeria monocytogenes TaxID=1639 RepID=UPI0011EAFFAE|nr:hypothetical protein [Listeria monocytogenes]TYT94611.1 hypothetical protein FZW83_07695 [Listeria monocytogenes]
MDISLAKKDAEMLMPIFKAVADKAYKEGVADGRKSFMEYPELLTNKHLAEIFSCTTSYVSSTIVKKEGFPKFKHLQSRYPRNLVFTWIEENTKIMA